MKLTTWEWKIFREVLDKLCREEAEKKEGQMALIKLSLFADESLMCGGCLQEITNKNAYLLLTGDGKEVDVIYCEACKPEDD